MLDIVADPRVSLFFNPLDKNSVPAKVIVSPYVFVLLFAEIVSGA